MEKTDAVQKLHAEIESDDDFEKFLEREGLLVMDVYTEWCGPCISMTSSLEKLKLEKGCDNLHLAKCKSDKIKRLVNFRNTSEPTWLFASHNKLVNCLSGTNMPVLLETIEEELQLEEKCKGGDYKRNFCDWNCVPKKIDNLSKNKTLTKSNAATKLTMADYAKSPDIVEDALDARDYC